MEIKNAVVAGVAALALGTAQAALLDQYFEPTSLGVSAGLGVFMGRDVSRAQTFAVGITGQLTGIDLLVDEYQSNADLSVQLWSTVNGIPNGSSNQPLAQGWLLASTVDSDWRNISNFYHVDFGATSPYVTVGENIAIVLHTDSTTGGWGLKGDYSSSIYGNRETYAYGASFEKGNAGNSWIPTPSIGPVDFGFRTYVDVAPVPEPETYAMMLAGLGLLGFVARRRKQQG